MNKHKKGRKKEETGKTETKKKQFLKVGLSQKKKTKITSMKNTALENNEET